MAFNCWSTSTKMIGFRLIPHAYRRYGLRPKRPDDTHVEQEEETSKGGRWFTLGIKLRWFIAAWSFHLLLLPRSDTKGLDLYSKTDHWSPFSLLFYDFILELLIFRLSGKSTGKKRDNLEGWSKIPVCYNRKRGI
jgi:hypothetical protein